MNCESVRERLSAGQPLTASEEEHLTTCLGCRSMMDAFAVPAELLNPQRLERISRVIRGSLRPVRPLPSDEVFLGTAVAVFIAFSLVAATPLGFAGFRAMTGVQTIVYYGAIAICAVILGLVTAHEMIPGSKQRVHPAIAFTGTTLLVGFVAVLLFRESDLNHFVKEGVPCLTVGLVSACVMGMASTVLLRRGFATSLPKLGAAAGFFSGLAGVGVLALHCRDLNSAHIVVWHLGAMVLAGAGGAVLGLYRQSLAGRKFEFGIDPA